MSQWVRLWDDMPTDPKWRVIARRSGRPLSEVLSVFVFMMTNAGANATERGALSNWDDEDVGAALDIDGEHVCAIREAMQGKTLEGEKLSGWERRQPKREDNSSDRSKAWREEQKRKEAEEAERERIRTQANAEKRPDAEESREDKKLNTEIRGTSIEGLAAPAAAPRKASRARAKVPIDENFQPDEKHRQIAAEYELPQDVFRTEWRKFRNHHVAEGSRFSDWHAAWRKWCDRIAEFAPRDARAGPAPPQQTTDPIYLAAAKLMGEANGKQEFQTAGECDTGPEEGGFLELCPGEYRNTG